MADATTETTRSLKRGDLIYTPDAQIGLLLKERPDLASDGDPTLWDVQLGNGRRDVIRADTVSRLATRLGTPQTANFADVLRD